MSAKNNIENLFQDQFKDYQLEPSVQVWTKLSRKLRWKNFLQPRWESFNIAYLGGIILVASISVLALTAHKKTENNLDPNPKLLEIKNSNSEIIPMNTRTENSNSDNYNNQSEKESNTPSRINQNEIAKPTLDEVNARKSSENPIEEISSPSVSKNENGKSESQKPKANNLLPPQAFFTPSQNEGCVPLHIEFTNYSTEAVEYNWSFGDGGLSTEKNPNYIFDEAGEYFVSLSSINSNGEISIHRELVKAYPLPELQFSIDKTADNTNELPVYFYNYTKGAVSYFWSFGDGAYSDATDPIHIYSKSGKYDVVLKATSAEGCSKEMTLSNILKKENSIIKIPNAFCPNPSGPNGGYYSNGENTNEVFHPFFEEIPVEYQLRLFNRKGNLLFESKDINIGWDGYFMEKLQPHGVYIYKLRAKFENGESVVKMGDVTLFMK